MTLHHEPVSGWTLRPFPDSNFKVISCESSKMVVMTAAM